jgi:hypothetical protein
MAMGSDQVPGAMPAGNPGVARGPRKVRAKAAGRGSKSHYGEGRIRSQRAQILENLAREKLADLERIKAELPVAAGEVPGVVLAALAPPVAGSEIGRRLYTAEVCRALADDLVSWVWSSTDHYLLVEWLVERGIPQGSVTSILKNDPVFCAAWDYALTVQHARVLRRGLECRADAQVTKLVLMSAHGYKEQQEVMAEVGASRQMPGTIEEADRMIEALVTHRAALAGMVAQAAAIESAVVG